MQTAFAPFIAIIAAYLLGDPIQYENRYGADGDEDERVRRRLRESFVAALERRPQTRLCRARQKLRVTVLGRAEEDS